MSEDAVANMYSLTVSFRGNQNLVRLNFRGQKSAEAMYEKIVGVEYTNRGLVEIADDYGNRATIRYAEISAINFSDAAGELEANQDVSILQAHAQVKFQKRVEADPVLMQAQQTAALRAKLAAGVPGFQPRPQ